MAYVSAPASKVVKRLIELGVIPPQCRKFELIINVREPVKARFEVLVTEETLQKVADAFEEFSEEISKIAREAILV